MVADGLGLALTLIVTALTTRAGDWEPISLVVGLLLFAIVSNSLAIELRGRITLTGSFSALILAVTLLGPGPGVLIGAVAMTVNAAQKRLELRYALSSLCTWTFFPLVGGMLVRALEPHATTDLSFSGMVMLVYVVCNVLNFVLIWGYLVAADGRTWTTGFKDVFAQILPVDLATGLFVVGIVYVDRHLGGVSIILVTLAVLVFQYMARTALQAFERGEELEERNRQLAALQFGLISTTMKTLALRDHMTARHSAAVARYAREMAAELGLPPEEQELFHTAGLFHDIGKFIFPDSILLASRKLTDEEYDIVRRHPEVGAELIAEIEGYGPVADIVRHHHERIDGCGYPDRIAGDEIPLGSKILAVADVYDVITARDTYRTPVTTAEAFAELRRVAGTQLDSDLVELFIDLVTRRGVVFRHSSPDDFEAELALERRVADYAAPRKRQIAA
jgi:putative nucleotidyltransferase with HDIG domain